MKSLIICLCLTAVFAAPQQNRRRLQSLSVRVVADNNDDRHRYHTKTRDGYYENRYKEDRYNEYRDNNESDKDGKINWFKKEERVRDDRDRVEADDSPAPYSVNYYRYKNLDTGIKSRAVEDKDRSDSDRNDQERKDSYDRYRYNGERYDYNRDRYDYNRDRYDYNHDRYDYNRDRYDQDRYNNDRYYLDREDRDHRNREVEKYYMRNLNLQDEYDRVATVENRDDATVENRDDATVENRDDATVENRDDATVENRDDATVESRNDVTDEPRFLRSSDLDSLALQMDRIASQYGSQGRVKVSYIPPTQKSLLYHDLGSLNFRYVPFRSREVKIQSVKPLLIIPRPAVEQDYQRPRMIDLDQLQALGYNSYYAGLRAPRYEDRYQ